MKTEPVDVCLVVEGCYPFVTGGVSSWLDWLMRSQPDTTFGVVAIVSDTQAREIRFYPPPNLKFVTKLPLAPIHPKPRLSRPDFDMAPMVGDMVQLLTRSDPVALDRFIRVSRYPVRQRFVTSFGRPARPEFSDLHDSLAAWELLCGCYAKIAPNASFIDFFWAWRFLMGGFFSVLLAPVPEARAYHAISTGYAGLFGAIAARKTGMPFLITEHGIYTNERRIDLTMADWIPDMIDKGFQTGDPRCDVRDVWIMAFEAFARLAYDSASRITTLYAENQSFQRALGAAEDRLEVIANGIELSRFDGIERAQSQRRPCIALIGRVVPIKDIEGFIAAASLVRRKHPDVEFLIMGPTDEDPAYFEACSAKVEALGLRNTVRFTGKVNIMEYLGHIDIVVLTSISEAQPLVLLEAGAARVPCVATDVGSCREIIEGAPEEMPNLGSGGRVVPPMAVSALGDAINELLKDEELRRACGETLRQRVEQHFTSEVSSSRYADLYARVLAT